MMSLAHLISSGNCSAGSGSMMNSTSCASLKNSLSVADHDISMSYSCYVTLTGTFISNTIENKVAEFSTFIQT